MRVDRAAAQEMRVSVKGTDRRPRDFGDAPLRIGILLWPSFPLMSLAGLVESLRHAGDHGDDSQHRYATWDILGAAGSRIASSCGLDVETTVAYPNPSRFDYIFVIGGLLDRLGDAPQGHRNYIHAARRAGLPVTGVCTGSFVLAQEGLLDAQLVAVHPYHERDFKAAFPGHRIILTRDYVSEGDVTTALGGVSILPLMLDIIAAHFGPDRAAKTVHQMTQPSPDWTAAQPTPHLPSQQDISDPRIQKALVILDAQATQSLSIANLARALGLSERHFLRLFRAQVGTSPKDYLIETKMRAAKWMLQHTNSSVTEVAYATGFSSGANLADHCQKRLGLSPMRLRRTAMARE